MRQPLTNSTPRTEMPTHGAILLAVAFPVIARRQVLLPEPIPAAGHRLIGPGVPVLVVHSPLRQHHATAGTDENT